MLDRGCERNSSQNLTVTKTSHQAASHHLQPRVAVDDKYKKKIGVLETVIKQNVSRKIKHQCLRDIVIEYNNGKEKKIEGSMGRSWSYLP